MAHQPPYVSDAEECYDTMHTHAYLEEEHVSALHAGVEDLRGRHLVLLLAPHDGAAPLDARQIVDTRDVHDQRPVLVSVGVDLVAGPQEAHVLHVHACVQ